MTLKKLQEQFQSYLLKNNIEIVSAVADRAHLSAKVCLQIYQNSYYERAINAMSQDYPVLKAAIGDGAFSSLAVDYIKTYPSTDFNLRSIGKYLSDFILSKNPDFIMYADLARLEWMLCEIDFDSSEKVFKSNYNVVTVWKNYQENKSIIDFELLSDSLNFQIKTTC